jgi:hypothetical protein
VVVVRIVDITSYMGRIITAAVVVGIIIVDVARTYREVNPPTADTTFELDHVSGDAFAGLQQAALSRSGSGIRRNAKETDRQQASRQRG